MNTPADKVWKAFCAELTQEPTDDMKQALATALRSLVKDQEQFVCCDDWMDGMYVVDTNDINFIANELDSF